MRVPATCLAMACLFAAAASAADGVRVSERFGYDKEDSTRFIQAALDSDEPVIVLDRKDGPWTSTPLVCRRPKTVLFEDGAWLVAKRGEFRGAGDTLLTFDACRGVRVLGPGPGRCGFRMWRDDYMNTNLYARSEHRMGVSLRSCEDVLIEGIASNESGGDGLYISNRGRNSAPCRNVTVRNCLFDRNCRQGVSVISVDGLLMESVVMSNTRGMPPQAGIDFEPNAKGEMITGVVMRNCRTEGNAGCGYAFAPNYLDSDSRKVTALLENCASVGDGYNALNYSAAFRHRPGNDAEIPHDDYEIVLRGCRFERSGRQAVSVFTKPLARGRFVFESCRVENCGTDEPDNADFKVSVTGHDGYEPNAIEFRKVSIVQQRARPWLEMFESAEKPFRGEPTRLSGVVTVTADGATKTHRLDDAWRAENTPFEPCAKSAVVRRVESPLDGARIVDAKPGEPADCAPVFVKTARFNRPAMSYVFHARKGHGVSMAVFAQAAGNGPVKGRVVVCPFGDSSRQTWSKALKKGKTALRFEVPETGFYSLGLKAPNTIFGIISADVPVALDVTGGHTVVDIVRRPYPGYAGGRLFFWVPSGTAAVTAAYYGSGREALGASISGPDGAHVYDYPDRLGLRYARLDSPSPGLWSIDFKPPRNVAHESHRISLNGVPGWYFLSSEKLWKTERKQK